MARNRKYGLLITGDSASAIKALKLTEEQLKQLNIQQRRTAKGSSSLVRAQGALVKAFSAYAIYNAGKKYVETADAMKLLDGRLKLVTNSQEEFARAQADVFAIAQSSGIAIQSTGTLYTKFARATEELNISQADLATITKTVSEAIVVSGASANEADAAILQLSQGMASGVLRGQELNSVMEQTPRLARAIAQGMGVTIGELRELGKQGMITTAVVVDALKSQADTINKEFVQIPKTVGRAWTELENSTARAISQMDDALGITAKLAADFSTLAEAISHASQSYDGFYTLQGKLGDEIAKLEDVQSSLRREMERLSGQTGPHVDAQLKGLQRTYDNITAKIKATTKEIDDQNKKETELSKTNEALSESTEKNTQVTKTAAEAKKELAAAAKLVTEAIKEEDKEWAAFAKTIKSQTDADFKAKLSTIAYTKGIEDQIKVLRVRTTQGETAARVEEDWIRVKAENINVSRDQIAAYHEEIAGMEAMLSSTESTANQWEKIWDNAVENMQSAFGDLIYDAMFDGGISSFSDFTDTLLDLFKKMVAEMITAWLVSGIAGMFNDGNLSGFSFGGRGGSSGNAGSTAGNAVVSAGIGKGLNALAGTKGTGAITKIFGSNGAYTTTGGGSSGAPALLGPNVSTTSGSQALLGPNVGSSSVSTGGGSAGGAGIGAAGLAAVGVVAVVAAYSAYKSAQERARKAAEAQMFLQLRDEAGAFNGELNVLSRSMSVVGDENGSMYVQLDQYGQTLEETNARMLGLSAAAREAGASIDHIAGGDGSVTGEGSSILKITGDIEAAKLAMEGFAETFQLGAEAAITSFETMHQDINGDVTAITAKVRGDTGLWSKYLREAMESGKVSADSSFSFIENESGQTFLQLRGDVQSWTDYLNSQNRLSEGSFSSMMQSFDSDGERYFGRLTGEAQTFQTMLNSLTAPTLNASVNYSASGSTSSVAGFADGGISYGPQLAYVSEGKYSAEAHVPLPDGRSIPVSISGGGNGSSDNRAVVIELQAMRQQLDKTNDELSSLRADVWQSGQSVADQNRDDLKDSLDNPGQQRLSA